MSNDGIVRAVEDSDLKAGCADCGKLKKGMCPLFEQIAKKTGAPHEKILAAVRDLPLDDTVEAAPEIGTGKMG